MWRNPSYQKTIRFSYTWQLIISKCLLYKTLLLWIIHNSLLDTLFVISLSLRLRWLRQRDKMAFVEFACVCKKQRHSCELYVCITKGVHRIASQRRRTTHHHAYFPLILVQQTVVKFMSYSLAVNKIVVLIDNWSVFPYSK